MSGKTIKLTIDDPREKILVSRCLMGIPCRYHGRFIEYSKRIKKMSDSGRYILFNACPEVDGGLPTPRPPARVVGDRVIEKGGKDVTENYNRGARIALDICKREGIRKAYLLKGSPSCGRGYGITANLLEANGIRVVGV